MNNSDLSDARRAFAPVDLQKPLKTITNSLAAQADPADAALERPDDSAGHVVACFCAETETRTSVRLQSHYAHKLAYALVKIDQL
jgi:hypothetical protein